MSELLPDGWRERADSYLAKLGTMPKLQLSLVPTFLQNLQPIGEELGIDLWCKRDDMTAVGFGGNKTRKLDFLVAEAIQANATHLIAVGSVQSNFCRMTAAYASIFGKKCTLILGGGQRRHTGNHLLSELFGASCRYVESESWKDWEEEAARLEMKLLAQGEITYRMPIGGSTPVGTLGYALAFIELMNQAEGKDHVPSIIYTATSSGGTHAGLTVGQDITGWKGYIQGVAVAKSAYQLAKDTLPLVVASCGMMQKLPDVDTLHVNDKHIGEGYAIETEEAREAQLLFATKCGIVLDTVYTAKAAAGLIADARSGKIAQGETVVFLHTGGSPEVFG